MGMDKGGSRSQEFDRCMSIYLELIPFSQLFKVRGGVGHLCTEHWDRAILSSTGVETDIVTYS